MKFLTYHTPPFTTGILSFSRQNAGLISGTVKVSQMEAGSEGEGRNTK